jgi:hypothetical protein
MRRSLLAVVVAVGTIVSVAEGAPEVVPYESVPAAEYPFPLPKDATRQTSENKKQPTKEPAPSKGDKSGASRIQIYDVPRARAEVVTEVRAALKKDGWEITKDEPSPSGNAVRLTIKRSGKVWKASFTGDDKRAVIILTVP